ncbi:imidazole glycerol phosphate synthase subunit HisH [Helicobacter anseris]|uniref:Imidazole glycerol phosphate synthase subunit HisH n=1 Tax=Helicobacter anseris TaxID=375926 RepID=A0A3D8JA22_9HELI|nr:imidazole glycerol phosphate synthase subunit HisH [Helicobacter anseris]RDU74150.1 imidazole glycerol phosphate synthase subunit HisH [Helicobacter anseris]
MRVGIVDYGAGNIGSVIQAFEKSGMRLVKIKYPEEVKTCDKLILPGVGAFGDAIKNLRESNMEQALLDFIDSGKYFFGICVGMQLLFQRGFEFGEHRGLGVFDGDVIHFKKDAMLGLKIPHIGWNLCCKKRDAKILNGLDDNFFLYFVHSYHCQIKKDFIVASCKYGYEFPAIINKDNVFGIQPHPEKSDSNGLRILENFLKL